MSRVDANALYALVDTRQGSDSDVHLSRGNCFPLVARPFGRVHLCPQTDEGPWLFSPRTPKLQGVRFTNQPSPWIGDYGAFTVMAQAGPRRLAAQERAAAYRAETATFAPHRFAARLERDGVALEATAAEHGGALRVRFPDGTGRVIVEPLKGGGWARVEPDGRTLLGMTEGNTGGAAAGFVAFFAVRFSSRWSRAGAFAGREHREGVGEFSATRAGAYAEFEGVGDEGVTAWVGTSFISPEQALRNLDVSLGARPYDELEAEARAAWLAAFDRIGVEGGEARDRTVFARALYRCFLFPRDLGEPGPDGTVHRSPYDGRVHPGGLCADNGFWDTYRTVYPLLSLIVPDRLPAMLEGWVQSYREGGWFPQWASPGYRVCMVGTHIDAVFADAVTKGIRGFDLETAYGGLRKHATQAGDAEGAYGRLGLADYLERGWVGADTVSAATSRTLDYAYDDWCLSRIAAALGREDDASMFAARATHYRHTFDAGTGFMRGRNRDGSWAALDPIAWGGAFVEGAAWQHTFAVPHDPSGLAALYGGEEELVAKLEAMLAEPPRFEVGTYGFEIHEMTEMALADFGQYAHSNQPVHLALALFAAVGRPWRTQHWVRRVMREMYTPDAFPGDEDNGEMSAWFVLNAMGLFAACPGHPAYTLGSPLFDRVTLRPPGTVEAAIEAEGNGPDRPYVRGVTWRGEAHPSLEIAHAALAEGGTLRFMMDAVPRTEVVPEALRPHPAK